MAIVDRRGDQSPGRPARVVQRGRVAPRAGQHRGSGGAYVTSVPPYIDATGPFELTRGITPAVLTAAPDRHQLTSLLDLAAAGLHGKVVLVR